MKNLLTLAFVTFLSVSTYCSAGTGISISPQSDGTTLISVTASGRITSDGWIVTLAREDYFLVAVRGSDRNVYSCYLDISDPAKASFYATIQSVRASYNTRQYVGFSVVIGADGDCQDVESWNQDS